MALSCFSLKVRIFKVGRCLEAQTKISNLWEDARFLTYVMDDEDENSHNVVECMKVRPAELCRLPCNLLPYMHII